jgi:major membrane immunogen (membrane-anchored lipoprotein)
MKKIQTLLLALVATFMLIACGPSISGTYTPVGSNKTGITSLEFKSGNKIHMANGFIGNQIIELDYEIDGKNLKIKSDGQVSIWTLRDDGSLDIMGDVFKKK